MIETVRYARENRLPYLGLCLGMQVMVVEAARHLLGLEMAGSTEFDPETPDPVIDLMPDQESVIQMGGTMRLGVYPCRMVEGSISVSAYGKERVDERHRHRFEFNNAYREAIESAGLRAAGLSPDGRLVEIMEMDDQPFPWWGCSSIRSSSHGPTGHTPCSASSSEPHRRPCGRAGSTRCIWGVSVPSHSSTMVGGTGRV